MDYAERVASQNNMEVEDNDPIPSQEGPPGPGLDKPTVALAPAYNYNVATTIPTPPHAETSFQPTNPPRLPTPTALTLLPTLVYGMETSVPRPSSALMNSFRTMFATSLAPSHTWRRSSDRGTMEIISHNWNSSVKPHGLSSPPSSNRDGTS